MGRTCAAHFFILGYTLKLNFSVHFLEKDSLCYYIFQEIRVYL